MQVAKSAPVRLIFPSGEIAVRRALAAFGQTLRRQGVCAQDRGTVELALGEVLNNVVEHAYGPGQPGQIEVIGDLSRNAMAFYVRDSGRALGELRVPEGRLANHAVQRDDLPEGGGAVFWCASLRRRWTIAGSVAITSCVLLFR
nr:ATP-binding protein [Aquicoccus sp. G2-2]MEA1114543.1 ATP-binding protein [Aquicoccus sp. G2-2]